MGQGAAVILLFSGAAALVNIGYTSGLAIGPDKSLVALLGCLAVAAGSRYRPTRQRRPGRPTVTFRIVQNSVIFQFIGTYVRICQFFRPAGRPQATRQAGKAGLMREKALTGHCGKGYKKTRPAGQWRVSVGGRPI